MKKNLTIKSKKIRLILSDVDGVLTNGERFFSSKGEILKKFHVHDGMGVNLLLRNGINTVIVTKENSPIVKKWSKDMNVAQTLMGIKRKELVLPKVCKKFKLKPEQIAFIGDDVNDIPLLNIVGVSASPHNAIKQVKEHVDYVCTNNGGTGAFREFGDYILYNKFPKKLSWY